jgi:AcrR family transcriptional regulator
MDTKRKTDRRPQRTRRQLSHALVELIKEKSFDDITVQNVIDRADIGRSTFYTHFRDKEDLLDKDWEGFLTALAGHIDWDRVGDGSFVPVAYFFHHLKEAQTFYKGLVRSRKTDWIFRNGVRYFSRNIESELNARTGSKSASIPNAILAHFLANEMFSLLQWWLDHKMPFTPERMDEIYHELVTPSVLKALKGA